ncbi:MAG: N-acetylmuramoyl-L-alanine amidase [Anaerolineae bacterium]|nr:N-acetylmuramoyl-L-alanine amidase [Anaerolineae bacterium]
MPRSAPPARRLSRRDFLGLAGMTAIAGALTCVGASLGYLVADDLSRPRRAPFPTQPPAALSAYAKQIDRPGILERRDWGAREPDHSAENESGFYGPDNREGWRVYEGDLRAVYRTVVVHHSVLYEIDDSTTMRAIQQQHLELRGWADIAYHFGVGRNGQAFAGRPLNVRGTHVAGFNTGSVGVVFLGDFSQDLPTPAQLEIGRRLIDWLTLRLELTHLAGHGDFNSDTDCPGQYLRVALSALAQSAGLALGTGGYLPDSA